MLMNKFVPHSVPSCGLITSYITKGFIKTLKSLLLCLMLSGSYYAGKIGLGLFTRPIDYNKSRDS